VEADPYLAARCWQNRKALTWCCAVGLKTHGVFYVNEFDRGLSGFEADGKPMTVLTKPLDWLLAASGIQKLDLLSVDVEGTELEVWESIGEVRPTIVVMEYRTGCLPPKDKEIVERMMRDGYREVHRTAYNLIFEHHERK